MSWKKEESREFKNSLNRLKCTKWYLPVDSRIFCFFSWNGTFMAFITNMQHMCLWIFAKLLFICHFWFAAYVFILSFSVNVLQILEMIEFNPNKKNDQKKKHGLESSKCIYSYWLFWFCFATHLKIQYFSKQICFYIEHFEMNWFRVVCYGFVG